jgi:8-oxo-dGTP diphosphatase
MPDLKWHITTLVYAFRDGELLLMHRRKEPNLGLWSPPGGKINPGESPLEAAKRELTEETGLVSVHSRLVAVVSEIDEPRSEAWLMFAVRMDEPTGELIPDHREGSLEWFAVDEVDALPVPPADPHILQAVLSKERGVHFLSFVYDDGVITGAESHLSSC